jgi:hypothetical protein
MSGPGTFARPRAAARVAAFLVISLLLPSHASSTEVDRVQQYLGLTQATLKRPVSPAELDAAVLSARGVADVAALFESALASSLTVGGQVFTPELGGEAMLDAGRIRFVQYPDPRHPLLRRMTELTDDPRALLELLSQTPAGQEVLKTTGGLHALLYQMTRESAATDAQRRALRQAMLAAASVHLKAWSVGPERQLELIRQNEWRGRYVGFWHIHPPRLTAGGYAPGIEPSMEDMLVAVQKGQFLTIVFQPDGFDLFDLSGIGRAGTARLSLARVARHRSAQWRRRFREQVPGAAGTQARERRLVLPFMP